jgi:ribosome biogenesis GTPase A
MAFSAGTNAMSINWYPGHMHKATREMKEILPDIDILIEVLDARIPYSSENPVISQLRGSKPCIKLLNKSDLADPVITQQWLDYLDQQQGVKAMAITSHEPERIKNILDLCKKLVPKKANGHDAIQAMITGIPNVGKSTLINILAGRTIAKTGNEPAITKGQQLINLHNGLMLLDTPGILWPKFDNEKSGYRLATTGAIKETAMSYDDVAFFAVDYMLQAYPELLKHRYKLNEIPKSELEFLELIGRQRGCLSAGKRVNLDQIARVFIGEIRDATIGRISLETPDMVEQEKVAVALLIEQKIAEKRAKKERTGSRKNKTGGN